LHGSSVAAFRSGSHRALVAQIPKILKFLIG
jgi:hypothetical protein